MSGRTASFAELWDVMTPAERGLVRSQMQAEALIVIAPDKDKPGARDRAKARNYVQRLIDYSLENS